VDVNVISVKLSDASGGEAGIKKYQVGHALLSEKQTWVDSFGRGTVGPNDNRVSWAPGDQNHHNYIEEDPIYETANGRPPKMETPSHEKKPDDLISTEATESLSEKVTRVIKDNQGKGLWSERFFVFKSIYKLFLFVALNYVVTLAVFPS